MLWKLNFEIDEVHTKIWRGVGRNTLIKNTKLSPLIYIYIYIYIYIISELIFLYFNKKYFLCEADQ